MRLGSHSVELQNFILANACELIKRHISSPDERSSGGLRRLWQEVASQLIAALNLHGSASSFGNIIPLSRVTIVCPEHTAIVLKSNQYIL